MNDGSFSMEGAFGRGENFLYLPLKSASEHWFYKRS